MEEEDRETCSPPQVYENDIRRRAGDASVLARDDGEGGEGSALELG